MSQSKVRSLQEAIINVLIGFIVSMVANCVIMPLVGVTTSFKQDFLLTCAFTVVSLVRGYMIRRWFVKCD